MKNYLPNEYRFENNEIKDMFIRQLKPFIHDEQLDITYLGCDGDFSLYTVNGNKMRDAFTLVELSKMFKDIQINIINA